MDRNLGGAGRKRASRIAATVLLVWAIAAPGASAVTLNPPPPDFERCHASGQQTICEGNRVEPGHVEGTGIICFEGTPGAFELTDVSDGVSQHAARWYDADGNLVRRQISDLWLGTAWVNPNTGEGVRYHQSQTVIDVLAVPGELGTATETTTGAVNFLLPGGGAIVRNAGRTVFSFDGTLEFTSGPQAINDYFLNGDTAALQPLCDALAS
jgi:hypothetical protein